MSKSIQKRTITDLVKTRVTKYIADPKLSHEEILIKEVLFYWNAFVCLGSFILTVTAELMHAGPVALYGYTLLGMFAITFYLFGTGINFRISHNIQLYAYILVTFLFAGWMGGPLDSAGLIFCAMYCVFMVGPFRSRKMTIPVVLFYIAGVVLLFILDPYLEVHPGMTPRINSTFFAINLVWMTTSQLFFLMYFFNTWGQYEIREKERLKELDETKNRLFTNITHEFRTPITLILGLADQVAVPDAQSKQTIKGIKNNGKRLLRLVNQMLNLARLESGKMQFYPAQSDIVRYVEFIVHTFKPFAESKRIRLGVKASRETFLMDFDPEKIEEIITNLLSNALRYTMAGGKVDVLIDQLMDQPAKGAEWLQIRVQDNGIGIPEDQLQHIFDRFYRVEQNTKHHQEGSGVGLTLASENVRLMGGRIEVESKAGVGTKFTITLPVTRNEPVQENLRLSLEEAYVAIPQEVDQPLNPDAVQDNEQLPLLLIIEDHPEMIAYIKSLLRNAYRIITALNGASGLEKAQETIPDMIISDVMMPGMDGFEMLEHLKRDMRTSHIPVILLTAKADMQSRLEGLELGAEAYLSKPFDKRELRIRLRKMLEQRKILQRRYLSQNLLEQPAESKFALEDGFMRKVHGIIDQRLDDLELNVESFSKEIGMSRSQLYRKMKALTNLSVDRYIRKYRLHKAMELLKTTDINVGQVAFEVGIQNRSSFSRAFKEEFGYSPSEIISSI